MSQLILLLKEILKRAVVHRFNTLQAVPVRVYSLILSSLST